MERIVLELIGAAAAAFYTYRALCVIRYDRRCEQERP